MECPCIFKCCNLGTSQCIAIYEISKGEKYSLDIRLTSRVAKQME